MSVLKYWDGTEWKVLGTPAKSSTSYFSIDSNGFLTIKQEDSDDEDT